MSSPTVSPSSTAVQASWASLGLALGCAGAFVLFLMVDQMSSFDRTKQGVLTGFAPRTILYLVWAGEALAAIVGIGSFVFVRQRDRDSHAICGIAVRSVCGIALGLCGAVVLWLVVGHVVIGF